jgi:hypothetical protein
VTRSALKILFAAVILTVASCGAEKRSENRQDRLDTFLAALPDSIRQSFDSISCREDCAMVGEMLEDAAESSPQLAARLDSIIQAELIDSFSSEEVVYFFWFYFDRALETGSVRDP